MSLHLIADILSLVLIMVGALLSLAAAIGVHRFADTMSRIHAITKPQTAGLVLTVLGAIIRVVGHPNFGPAERGDLGILVLLILFAFLTSPVTGQRLARVARREGLYGSKEHLRRNDAPAPKSMRRR